MSSRITPWNELTSDKRREYEVRVQQLVAAQAQVDSTIQALKTASAHVLFCALGLRHTKHDHDAEVVIRQHQSLWDLTDHFRGEMLGSQSSSVLAQYYYEIVEHSECFPYSDNMTDTDRKLQRHG